MPRFEQFRTPSVDGQVKTHNRDGHVAFVDLPAVRVYTAQVAFDFAHLNVDQPVWTVPDGVDFVDIVRYGWYGRYFNSGAPQAFFELAWVNAANNTRFNVHSATLDFNGPYDQGDPAANAVQIFRSNMIAGASRPGGIPGDVLTFKLTDQGGYPDGGPINFYVIAALLVAP